MIISLQLLLALGALGACYVLLRELRATPVSVVRMRTVSLIALMCMGMVVSFGYTRIFDAVHTAQTLPTVVSLFGLLLLLTLVILHRFRLQHREHYPESLVHIVRRIGYGAFGTILFYICIEALIVPLFG